MTDGLHLPSHARPSKRRLALFLASLTTAIASFALIVVPAPAARASNVNWYYTKYYDGTATTYVPDVVDYGAACYPVDTGSGTRYWIMFPGPVISDPETSNNYWKTPGSSSFPLAGAYYSSSGIDYWNQLMYGNSTGDEYIFYVPAVNYGGQWHYALHSNNVPQWMRAVNHGTPGAGAGGPIGVNAGGGSYSFWRYNDNSAGGWEDPEHGQFDFSFGDGYGSNWEWDSEFVPGPGTYAVGGYVAWDRYNNSDNGNGPFPGEYGFFRGVDVTCGGASSTRTNAVGPAPAAPNARVKTHHKEAPMDRMRIVRSLRTPLRTGHTFSIADLVTYNGDVVKNGKIYCEASFKRIHGRDDRGLLPTVAAAKIARYHQRTGLNACVWRVPARKKGQRMYFAMHLVTRHHGQTVLSGDKLVR